MTKKLHVGTVFRYALPILIAGYIFYLSSEGHELSSGRSLPIAEMLGLAEWFVRKSAHFIIYFLLGMSVANLDRRRESIPAAIGICGFYATIDEFHQSWNPERSGQVSDILLDTTASILGILTFHLLLTLHRKNVRIKK
jgi:hypothetical protein